MPGCDVRLPLRALDEQGRPKGGRRPRYCGKPHTDAASRQRKARDLESVADPLALARTAGEAFLPSARQLADQLSELIARFDQAEAGALGRVRTAEQEAAQALADTAVARDAAETAEQARRQALAQARADRQARDNAVKEADHARQDLERIRTAAWEQVVGHERARGQAEAARVAAETTAEGLATQNRALREQLELTRSATVALTDQIAVGTYELERSRGETLALSARIETVEQLRTEEADRLREQVATLEELASGLRHQLAEERSARQAEGRALDEARRTLSTQARRRRKHRPPTTRTAPVPDPPAST